MNTELQNALKGNMNKTRKELHPVEEKPPREKAKTKDEIAAEETARIVASSAALFLQKPCKDNEELAERLQWYFMEYARDGIIPTPEGMCLAIGSTWRQVSAALKSNKDAEKTEILNRAIAYISEVNAQLVISGKTASIPYIFRGKNFFGMTDEQQVILTPNVAEKSKEELIAEASMLPESEILAIEGDEN